MIRSVAHCCAAGRRTYGRWVFTAESIFGPHRRKSLAISRLPSFAFPVLGNLSPR